MDKVNLYKIVLQRRGDSTASPLITLYPEWIKSQPRISFACEDLIGEVISPQIQFSVYFDSLPSLLNEDLGGILYNYDAETEDILCQIWLDDDLVIPAWLGNISSWQWSQGDQALIMQWVGGLEILRRLNLEDIVNGGLPGNALWTEDQIGRYADWLINQIYGNNDLSMLFPLTYNDYRLSYAEHPERRFCEGQDSILSTPTSYTRALAVDGTIIYACAKQYVLGYDTTTHLWTYYGAITGYDVLTGYDPRVIGLNYSAGVLKALVEQEPISPATGSSPDPNCFKVYEIDFTLATGTSSLIRTWYQHTHERIASRDLRYTCNGTGGTAYASAECIGQITPAPYDQTYATDIYPIGSTVVFFSVANTVTNVGLIITGTGLGINQYDGIVVYIGGKEYHPDYIESVQDNGVQTTIFFHTPLNLPAIYIVTLPATDFIAHYPSDDLMTPNVFIGYPTMVEVEYSAPTSWGGNPRKVADVRVYKRNSAYGTAASHIALATGKTLPCMLEPGWYVFKTETGEWADHPAPSTDKTEADACPFVIKFERPRYICDFANGWTQRDEPHNTPPIWGHERGRGKSYIYLNNVRLSYRSDGKDYSKSDINIVTYKIDDLMDESHWGAYQAIGGSLYDVIAESRFTHGTAYISHNGYHHIAEQAITFDWADTGGEIAYIFDSGNLLSIPWGISDDIYCEGAVDLAGGDIIGISASGVDPTINDRIGYMVDSVESVFRDLGVGAKFYTKITVYPQVSTPAGAIGLNIHKLISTRRLGRWLRYDSNFTNMTVLHNCTLDTTRDIDGQQIARFDANNPAGQPFTVELDDNGLCKVKLTGIAFTTPVVVQKGGRHIRVESRDPFGTPQTYPIPNNPQLCYYETNCGDNQDEFWLVFHPSMVTQQIFVQVQYQSDDYWISDFWEQGGDIYAMEEGTGLILKYDGSTVTVHQDLGRSENGGNALAIAQDTNNSWMVTAPAGYLARFSQIHSGHIDKLSLNLKVPDALGAIAKACDARVFITGTGKLKFISNQGMALAPTVYDKYSVRSPYPVVSTGIETENIRITYDGGMAQATKDIRYRQIDMICVQTYAHANKICVDYYNRGGKGTIEIVVPLADYTNELGEEITVPMPDVPWRLGGKSINGRIINYDKDTKGQVTPVRARRS